MLGTRADHVPAPRPMIARARRSGKEHDGATVASVGRFGQAEAGHFADIAGAPHDDDRGTSSSVVASRSGSANPRTHFCDAFVSYFPA